MKECESKEIIRAILRDTEGADLFHLRDLACEAGNLEEASFWKAWLELKSASEVKCVCGSFWRLA